MHNNLPGQVRIHPGRNPLDDFEKAARGAFSQHTERGRASDLRIYTDWCIRHHLTALPAFPTTLAAFIDDMAHTRAPASVCRYLSSIAMAHRAIGHHWVADHPLVKMAKRRMYRTRGRRQEQALGLTWTLRRRILRAGRDRLIDARNRALLATAYDTLLRRSELTSLELPDLTEKPNGSATVLVRRGKTDPAGDGAMAFLARDTMELVNDWIEQKCHPGRVPVPFPQVRGGGGVSRSQPGPSDLQGHGAGGGAVVPGGGGTVGAQYPGGTGAGHGGGWDRDPGDHAGRGVAERGHGEPLRGAVTGEPERLRPARPLPTPQVVSSLSRGGRTAGRGSNGVRTGQDRKGPVGTPGRGRQGAGGDQRR